MENVFEKYYAFEKEDGKIVGVRKGVFDIAEEAFLLFKSLYNTHYGSIDEDKNLISIHTGGWSDNEALIEELKQTGWWFKYHMITQTGGHYFFDTDFYADKKWRVVPINESYT